MLKFWKTSWNSTFFALWQQSVSNYLIVRGFLFWQEHFLDNAKLSENYFIADCEESLVSFYHSPLINQGNISQYVAFFLTTMNVNYFGHFTFFNMYLSFSNFALDVNCNIDVRKLLLLLMNCRSGCMISSFSASGIIFYPSEKVKIWFSFSLSPKFLEYDYLFWWTSPWMENLVDWAS